MSLQIRFGIAGAALGLLLGIIGGLVGQLGPGTIILRTLVDMVIGGVVALVLHGVVNRFLPELLQENSGHAGDELAGSPGHTVNITLPEDGPPVDNTLGADQAEALRQTVRHSGYAGESGFSGAGEADGDSDMIEEVSEDRRSRPIGTDAVLESSFNEAAFYDGVERLPDIGGFSEQFQAGDENQESGEADSDFVSDGQPAASGPSHKNKSGQTNMDPALIAQAIRTALKKEDR